MAAPPAQHTSEVDHWISRISATTRDHQAITNPQGTAEWSAGFFDCFRPADSCCITCCCPCITFGKTYHRLHKDPNLAGYSPVNGSCLLWYLAACCGLHCIPQMIQRAEISQRAQPNLRGNFATDFLKAWCCNCCDLMQQDKEAARLAALGPAQVISQPAPTQGMTYAPPQ